MNKPELYCCSEEILITSGAEGGVYLKLTEVVSEITDPLLKNSVPDGATVMLVSFTGCCDIDFVDE